MKKYYLFYLMAFLFSWGFSQSTIVTVDRANVIGPTATGNDPSIGSTGLTRGSGINLSNAANANFSSNSWNATSQTEAVTNNEYIEWSVSASGDNSIEITEFDIRNRINANGPANWQVFYSLDNFATAGIEATDVQASSTTATNYNFNDFSGSSIISGTSGTITFRLYAWNAVTNGGMFRIQGRAAWSDFGVSTPGIRIIGNITTTAVNDTESNIVTTNFVNFENINYTVHTRPDNLTVGSSFKAGEFAIQDGGDDLTDTDAVGTILTELELDISKFPNILAIAIFDGSTNIAEASAATGNVIFSGITGLSAADNSSKTFDVRVTFKQVVTDNDQFQISIISASADAALGSTFDAFDAGGAQTSIAGDDNRIEVVATRIIFGQQPTDVNQFETMAPFPTVLAVDARGSLDLDYSNSVSVQSSDGDLEPSTIIYPITNGIALLNTLVFTEKDVVPYLTALEFGLGSFAPSVPFNVTGPLINIVKQDFDGFTPEWTYTTDITTFDNSWGVNGYYGVIDSAIAAPLDNGSFVDNIFGENDLNDEGNGTNGFATLTFDTIDISSFDDIRLSFDWDIHGYDANSDDAQYRLIYDGSNEPWVFLLNGNDGIETDQGTITIDIPNTVDSIALEVRVRNNGENGYSGFDNFRLSSVFDGLIYIDDGSSVGWEPSAPDATTGSLNAYVYSGTYNVGTDVVVNDFIIRNGATTTISSQQSLIVNSTLQNNGTLELNSNSTGYSSLITDKVNGDVIYNRHVNQFSGTGSSTGNNDLISAPVTDASQTYLAFRTTNTDIPSGTIDGVPSFLFGPFDNATNEYINHPASDVTTVIEPGIGYRTASTIPTGSTFEFAGDVITGSLAVPITVGAGSRANLIGNPYPSYLKLSTFLTANSTQFSPSNSGVYGYVGNVLTGFRIWNQAYSDANPTAKIAPGQGFFVISKNGGGTINFTPDMRTKGTSDDFIVGRSANQDLAHVYLQVAKGEELYQTDLYFNDNASLSMDAGYDAEMFEANTPSFAIYSHLVEDNLGKDFAVQSVSYSDLNNVTIPLGINVAQGEQAVISISEMNIPDGTTVILEDNTTNTFTNLLESDYTFTPTTTLNDTGRFYIHFSSETLGLNDDTKNSIEISTDVPTKTIVVKGQLESQTKLNLYDIQGRLVISQSINSKNLEQRIDVSSLTAGIYVVELQNNTSTNRTQKVIIR
ncbi:T9SS type A sorting domain-containing protein [Winogradskyella forsetii]|uniref:T9SS type A sorting domain-containing protein n=1 Tax=Winogradskyella forsetii TaxID=2686077 RepID=UPI0015BB4BF3|nr:T9SS type A sorting domain-containing protein [Winogradskyella forsetii]